MLPINFETIKEVEKIIKQLGALEDYLKDMHTDILTKKLNILRLQQFLVKSNIAASSVSGIPNRPPRIGVYWPGQGGVYAGLVRGHTSQPDYRLIVADEYEYDGEVKDIAWGSIGTETSGADHEWDGKANTHALADSENEHPAAEWAHQLELKGFSDWYLPSRRELALCYANVPEQFAKTWYWSSTQYSADSAWGQHFGDGIQLSDRKSSQARARAVRRIPYELSFL
jgi:hypothetical protein